MNALTISVLFFLVVCCSTTVCLQFRTATKNDIAQAQKLLLQEKMNPLSLQNLLVTYDDDGMIGFGQIRSLDSSYSELASLYVLPEQRSKGVGGAIVEGLLDRHTEESTICLLTLRPTAPFYERYGFSVACKEERDQLPSSIQLEFKAGAALSFLLGNDLVCMIQK